VLAVDDGFADALAGVPLAAAKGGPVLLTHRDSLDVGVGEELVRILPPGATVYLLGGERALSARVSDGVAALGFTVVRYGGATRFDTATIIADQGLGEPATVLEVTGLDFADSLAAGAAAAGVKGAVLLTDGATQSTATAIYLSQHPDDARYAIGGPAAAADPAANPIVGSDRYQTSTLVASTFFLSPQVIGIASGLLFPDALSGGAHIGRLGGPLLLTDPQTLPISTEAYLAENRTTDMSAYIYGGTFAVSDAVEAAVDTALGRADA